MSMVSRLGGFWGGKKTNRKRRSTHRLRGQLETLETRSLLASVLTYHNDIASTGVNDEETVLTRANVNATTFGKVFSVTLDGDVYAQPLVVEDVNITAGPNAGVRDVTIVTTQHGSVYAIDAAQHTSGQGVILWKRSLLDTGLPGATAVEPVRRDDVGSGYPETVTVGTPVVDQASNTLFLLSKTRETVAGKVHFVQRMNALNLSTGASRTTPFLIGDTVHLGNEVYTNNSPVWVNGTGDGNDGNGHVYFNAMRAHTRTALRIFEGVVYAGWASHESRGPYHGWVIGFDMNTLGLKAVFNTTPNGGLGGIWQSGGGLASDGEALYFQTANGTFDGNNGNLVTPSDTGTVTGLDANGFPIKGNYGNSIVKVVVDKSTSASNQNINGWGLKVVDYFTPFNQKFLEERDLDLGSGAPLVLPDEVGSAAHPHLLVGAGKEGIMYLVDRDNMGKFGTKNNNLQTVGGQLSGSFDTPAYFDGSIFYVEGFGGTAKTFSIANGVMSETPTSRSLDTYTYAGSTPSISANGEQNGIVWDVDRGTNQLRAYSTDSYAEQLYHSGQAAGNRDRLGSAATFQVPTVANGRVYLGTASGATSTLVVYGLITPPNAKPAAPSNLQAVSVAGTQVNLSWQANDVSPNIAVGYVLEKSANNGVSWTQIPVGTVTNFTVGGLQKSTAYKFRVSAMNTIGSSATSNVLSVTTTADAGGLNFAGGFDAAAGNILALNGAPITNGALVLTNGLPAVFQGVFSKAKQDITKFSTSFDFQINGGPSANGFTFVIQSDTTVGDAGGWQTSGSEGLAYGSVSQVVFPNSLAIKFDLFRTFDLYEYSGDYISTTGVYQNGAMPTTPEDDMATSGIDLHSGNKMTAVINYDSATKKLSLTVTDTVTKAQFTKVYTDIDLPQAVGGGSAYVGFTAASGRNADAASTQRILNWTFAPAGPPNTPENLRTQVIGQVPGMINPPPLSVELTWSEVDDAVQYVIERRFGLVGNYETIATVPAGVTKYTNANTATQADYYYRIKASNGAGDSAFSADVIATTPGRVPTPRFGKATAVTETSIAFEWTDLATNEDVYHIVRRSGASPYSLIAVIPANPGTGVMNFVDVGLDPSTNYDYHIQAINLTGYSDYSGVNTDTLALSGGPEAHFGYVATPRNTDADSVVLHFSEAVTGFSKADLALTRNGNSVSLTNATVTKIDDKTYAIDLSQVTTADGNYKLTLKATGSGIVDASSTALTDDAVSSWVKETKAPTVTSFAQVTPGPNVTLTAASKLVYNLKFSEPVSAVGLRSMFSFGLTAHDPVITTTDNVNFQITIDQLSGSGPLSVKLNDATNPIRDMAGNALAASAYPAPLSITVDRVAPTVAMKFVRLEKGSTAAITSTQLLASDGRVAPDGLIYTVKTLPAHLTLKVGGKALKVGDKFNQLDINTVHFTFTHDDSDALTDTFTYTVSDGLNTTSVKTLTFQVTPFNAVPAFSAVAALEATKDTPLPITGVSISDADAGQNPLKVTVIVFFGRASLGSTAGLTFSNGTGTLNAEMTFTGKLADINNALAGLKYTPKAGYVGSAKINLEVNDLGGNGGVAKSSKRQIVLNVVDAAQTTTLNLTGTSGDDVMKVSVGTEFIDYVIGGTTYQYPRGKIGTINVAGGAGNDKINIASTLGLTVNVRGGDGDDALWVSGGVKRKVSLYGEKGDDVLTGGSGGDILSGGPGNDRLIGGDGSDRYLFGNAMAASPEVDTVVEIGQGGNDALDFSEVNVAVTVDLQSDTNLAVQSGRKIVTGAAGQFAHFEGVVGGKGDDVIRGNNGKNYLSGSAGNDIVQGFKGDDTLLGGDGNDVLIGGNGNDALRGGRGNDDYIFAVVSANGTTFVAETDTITELTNQGLDTLDFSSLTTPVTVDLTLNTPATHLNRTINVAVVGQFANLENVFGGAADDTIRGNGAANFFKGNAGRDLLLGKGGADTIVGGEGNDRMAGGDGSDRIIGGVGDDSYEFADVTSGFQETDTIVELANEGTDKLDFRGVHTPVTISLKSNPMGTHDLRTVVPENMGQVETFLRNPPAAAASSSEAASFAALVDAWMSDDGDEDRSWILSDPNELS